MPLHWQLILSYFLVNAWVLIMQLRISQHSGLYCVILSTIHVLKNVNVLFIEYITY